MAEEARNAQYQRRGQEEAEKKRMAEEEQKAASPDAATKEAPRSKRGGEEGSEKQKSYHQSTCQWHARSGSKNFAPSWGNELRSEKMALLLCLKKLWTWNKECGDLTEPELEKIAG